jgi:serine/threonine-protein kinase
VRQGEFKAGEVIPGTRYRVRGLLGIGGMGSVYEVEHVELGKRFVLKALLSDLARRDDLVARLRNEQRALGRLEHPSIINVTDAGATSSNIPYFVMERLDGETLGTRLKRTGYLPIGEALEIAAAVLDGLAAAHEIGIVHRDIKPPNIFLVQGKYPKILDFGVAKMDAAGGITARGVAVGTPRYMSPEQASGESLDGRSDIYAVGLLLYESVVGKGPFDDARDANEMLLAHLSRPPSRLSASVGSVTRELDDLVTQLLAKNPGERPASAREAATRLRAIALPYARGPLEPVGHALTVRLNVQDPAPTTRADGVAARQAWGLSEGKTEDAKTLARKVPRLGPNKTLITEQRRARTPDASAEVTLKDYAGTAPPPTRTEILPVADAPWPGDVETRTSVPVTPTDGSRTIDVPVSEAASAVAKAARSKRPAAIVATVLVIGAVALGAALTHGVRAQGSAARAPAVARALPARPEAHAVTLASAPVVPTSPGAAPSGVGAPTVTPRPSDDGHANGASSAPTSRAAAVVPPPKKPVKQAKSGGVSPRIPDGLPSSGL